MRNQELSKKSIALILAFAMIVGTVIGGTIAWLTAKTDEVTNVFTTSNISITLQEHEYDAEKDELTDKTTTTGVDNYKMVPGWTIPKDPLLTVEGGSEDCWLFIKVEEKGGNVTVDNTDYTFDSFIDYKIDEHNWTQLIDEKDVNVDGVYYCYANDIDKDRNIKILAGGEYVFEDVTYTWEPNQVLTKPDVTKEMMNAIDEENKPTLSFTAYASQYWKNNTEHFEAIEAWNIINSDSATP